MEVARRQGSRLKKLLYDLKDRRGYSHFKEESLDCTMWRNRFGGGFGPVVRQNNEWRNELSLWPRSTGANDILGIASGTWGAAALRFIVVRKYGCAARYGVLLARRRFSFCFDRVLFIIRCMKNNCESCEL